MDAEGQFREQLQAITLMSRQTGFGMAMGDVVQWCTDRVVAESGPMIDSRELVAWMRTQLKDCAQRVQRVP